jgi:hypothetical protein
MRRAPLFSPWFAAVAGAALVAGCASVLGVDKTYELADAGVDAGTGDAVAEAGATGIRCAPDAAACDPGSEECCFSGTANLTCVSTASGDPCPQGTDIPCDDPSDCTSGVCCIQLDMGGDVLGTSCAASKCASGQIELCAQHGGVCTEGQCTALEVSPNPPFVPDWFYGCQ